MVSEASPAGPDATGRYATSLAAAFAIWWLILAIAPRYRSDWILENVLTVLAAILLVTTYRRFPFSRISYTALFLFACLHTLGAHYTYSEVPYDEWSRQLTGRSLNEFFGWERNHFDRFVHFAYGLLAAYPIREVYVRVANARGFWGYFLPLDFTMSTSMIYELVEWGAAEVLGGDLGTAYLGTQGDVWDAHKDMALASLGAIVAMALVIAVNRMLQRDFAQEWVESVRIKRNTPLGEIEIERMLADETDAIAEPADSADRPRPRIPRRDA